MHPGNDAGAKRKNDMQMLLPQMEKKKPRLTILERQRIEEMLNQGWTPYKIAKALGRPPKTIMREIVNRAIRSESRRQLHRQALLLRPRSFVAESARRA